MARTSSQLAGEKKIYRHFHLKQTIISFNDFIKVAFQFLYTWWRMLLNQNTTEI